MPRDERDFLTNPYWIEDPELKKGEVDFLSSAEVQFWKDLIDKYLYPIDQDKAEQVGGIFLVILGAFSKDEISSWKSL